MNDTTMTDAEATMREEGWIPSSELLAAMPPALVALQVLQGDAWDQFMDDITGNPALRFFSAEQREFSHAEDWEALAAMTGFPAFGPAWRIPDGLPDDVNSFCRSVRARGVVAPNRQLDPQQQEVFRHVWDGAFYFISPTEEAVLQMRLGYVDEELLTSLLQAYGFRLAPLSDVVALICRPHP